MCLRRITTLSVESVFQAKTIKYFKTRSVGMNTVLSTDSLASNKANLTSFQEMLELIIGLSKDPVILRRVLTSHSPQRGPSGRL